MHRGKVETLAGKRGGSGKIGHNGARIKRGQPMTYQKMKEMVYRTIYIDGWASHVGVQTQTTRDLKIHTAKLRRLSWWDKINFLETIESPKKAVG